MTTFKDLRLTWTDCDEAEDYIVPKVLSPRDLVFRPDIMDETVYLLLLMFIFNKWPHIIDVDFLQ